VAQAFHPANLGNFPVPHQELIQDAHAAFL
jgi:hypothetical protein